MRRVLPEEAVDGDGHTLARRGGNARGMRTLS
jgi:hypothetical protein